MEHAHPFNYPAMIPSADATLLSAPPQVYRPRDLSRVYIPTVQNDTLSSHDPTADGDDTVERGSEPYSSSPQHLNVPLHDAVIFPKTSGCRSASFRTILPIPILIYQGIHSC